jgi:glyoxylase-like metal-dependent hydrolase (beta-lactamase superfamily II)
MHAHFDHVCGIPVLRRQFPRAEETLKQALLDRLYRGNLGIYTPDNIRLCVDLLVRRSMEIG